MGDEIVEAGFLLFGQSVKLESKTAEVGGREQGPGVALPYPNQAHWDVLQIKIFVFQKKIKGHVLGRNIIEKDGLKLHPAGADIHDGKRYVVDEGEGPLTHLKSWMLTPFPVTNHVHLHSADHRPGRNYPPARPSSLLLKRRQYSNTSSRLCTTLRRK